MDNARTKESRFPASVGHTSLEELVKQVKMVLMYFLVYSKLQIYQRSAEQE